MLKSCTSITAHNTGPEGWKEGDGRLGFVVSPVPKCEGPGPPDTRLSSSSLSGTAHTQRAFAELLPSG